MTSFVYLCCRDPERLDSLVEETVSWGADVFPKDPRTLASGTVRGTLGSLSRRLRTFLPEPLSEKGDCLVLDVGLVNEWSHERLSDAAATDLQRVLAALAERDDWAIVVSVERGQGVRVERLGVATAYDAVGAALRGVDTSVVVLIG